MAPGASAGVLHAHGAVTLQGGAIFSVELKGTGVDEYDQLDVNSNSWSLQLIHGVRPDLQVSLGFTPVLGDTFNIVTGLSRFDPSLNGTFEGKPNGSTFYVGTTELKIVYGSSSISLTVVPEPSTLWLLGLAGLAGVLRRRWLS